MNQLQNSHDTITYDKIISFLCPSHLNIYIDKLNKFNEGDNLFYCIKKYIESNYNNFSQKEIFSNINSIKNITEKDIIKLTKIFDLNIILYNFNNINVYYHENNPLKKKYLAIKKNKLYYILLDKNNNSLFDINDNLIKKTLKEENIIFNYKPESLISNKDNEKYEINLNTNKSNIEEEKKIDINEELNNNNTENSKQTNEIIYDIKTINKLKKMKKDELIKILQDNDIIFDKKQLKDKLCKIILENKVELEI